jgi:hypothetical protein
LFFLELEGVGELAVAEGELGTEVLGEDGALGDGSLEASPDSVGVSLDLLGRDALRLL